MESECIADEKVTSPGQAVLQDVKENEKETEAGENGSTLFIGNLSRYCKEVDLLTEFAEYNVCSANIKVMKGSRMPLGYGFLQFRTHDIAAKCKRECNGKAVNGRKVKLSWAQRNTRLIISNLDHSVTLGRLHDMFRRYGGIEEELSYLLETDDGHVSGVIEYELRSSAERAKQEVNNRKKQSNRIRADWYTGPNTHQSTEDSNSEIDGAISVYFRFECQGCTKLVDETCISEDFSKFGHVIDVNIKGSYFTQNGGQEGFGFVHFENKVDGINAALSAVKALQWAGDSGVSYWVEASKNLLRVISKGSNPGQSTLIPTESQSEVQNEDKFQTTDLRSQNQDQLQFYLDNEGSGGDLDDCEDAFQNMQIYIGSPDQHASVDLSSIDSSLASEPTHNNPPSSFRSNMHPPPSSFSQHSVHKNYPQTHSPDSFERMNQFNASGQKPAGPMFHQYPQPAPNSSVHTVPTSFQFPTDMVYTNQISHGGTQGFGYKRHSPMRGRSPVMGNRGVSPGRSGSGGRGRPTSNRDYSPNSQRSGQRYPTNNSSHDRRSYSPDTMFSYVQQPRGGNIAFSTTGGQISPGPYGGSPIMSPIITDSRMPYYHGSHTPIFGSPFGGGTPVNISPYMSPVHSPCGSPGIQPGFHVFPMVQGPQVSPVPIMTMTSGYDAQYTQSAEQFGGTFYYPSNTSHNSNMNQFESSFPFEPQAQQYNYNNRHGRSMDYNPSDCYYHSNNPRESEPYRRSNLSEGKQSNFISNTRNTKSSPQVAQVSPDIIAPSQTDDLSGQKSVSNSLHSDLSRP